ncbi:MAG: caspase family protein [Elainellaceae cyanobacterium]
MSRDALIVGINSYHYPHLPTLRSPADDAEAVASMIANYGEFRVQRLPERVDADGSLHVSRKQSVTLRVLKDALVKLFKPEGDHIPDTALFFFSGHGLREEKGIQEGFLATSDANPEIGFHGLSLQWLRRLLEESPIRQQIVWLDCCYGGELLNFEKTLEEANPKNTEERDRCLITACREFESSYEQTVGPYSVLTGVLMKGLDPTQRPDGWVTNYTITEFINEKLSAETQCPIFHNYGNAIVLTTNRQKPPHDGSTADWCPYKALAYFREADANLFYGRTHLTDELIRRVEKDNFVAIIGPSGSGKSSVLRAGLLHQLRLGKRLTGSHAWRYLPVFAPGEHPLQSLQTALGTSVDQLESLIAATPAQRVVMVVDQFEECFTLCQSHSERQQFFSTLLSALEQTSPTFCLIIAMRADFLGHCTEYRILASHIDRHVTVKPMSDRELEEAIVQPALDVGLQVEPQLVNRIIDDVIDSPGSLPLLQFALTILWETREAPYENWLTLSAYNQLGGIRGTLEKVATDTYKSLSDEEQQIAKRIFLELTHVGVGTEDTRRRIAKHDLVVSQQSKVLLEQVLQTLVDARLIITDESGAESGHHNHTVVIDVAHEALIRHWGLLRQWLKDSRDALRKQREIQEAANDWYDQGKPQNAAFLLRGSKLTAAEEFLQSYEDILPLSTVGQEFVKASIRHRRRSRQFQLAAVALFIASIGTAAAIAIVQGHRAVEQAVQSMATSSINLLQRGDQLGALLEGAKAGDLLDDAFWVRHSIRTQTITALQQTLYSVQEANRLSDHRDVVNSVEFSSDGTHIITGSWDGTLKLWQADGTLLWTGDHEAEVMSASISTDGRIVSSDTAGTIQLWQINGDPIERVTNAVRAARVQFSPTNPNIVAIAGGDGTETVRFWHLDEDRWVSTDQTHQGRVTDIQFSPDGRVVASVSEDRTLKLWNVENGALLASVSGHADDITSVSFSPDGRWIASGDRTGEIKIWAVEGESIQPTHYIPLESYDGEITSLAFSPNGNLLAMAQSNGTVTLFRVSEDELLYPLERFRGHDAMVRSVAFDAEGRILASAGDDGTARLWRIRQNWHDGEVWDVSISPDGSMYASASSDRTVKLWDAASDRLLQTFPDHDGTVYSVVFSPNQQIVTASTDQITVWNIAEGDRPMTLTGHDDYVLSLSLSPDGQRLASASDDTTVRLWDMTDGSLIQTLTGHLDGVQTVQFSHDGTLLASGGWDQTVRLWDANGTLIRELQHDGGVSSVAFSPDDEQLISASHDGTIYLWRIADGEQLGTGESPHGGINQLAFHPDGHMFAAASGGYIVLFDSETVRTMRTLSGHQLDVTSLEFSADGDTLLSGSKDRSIIAWSFNLSELMQQACDRLSSYLTTNPDVSQDDQEICDSFQS